MRNPVWRRGVASVIGTVFFVVVFLLALGALAYASGLQAQASQAELQAQAVASTKGGESLSFSQSGSGLAAVNQGRSSMAITYLILKYPNGTVYSLPASAEISTGERTSLKGLIPAGICSPGAATCLSKFTGIASGNPQGGSIGVVTSLGNSFWYVYSAPQQGPGGYLASFVSSSVVANSINRYVSTTLMVNVAANTTYSFEAFTAIEPQLGTESYDFEVHALPPGSSLVIACSPMSYPNGGGNTPTNCVTSTSTPVAVLGALGFGVAPPVYATPGVFGVVKIGATAGMLQLDFACVANCGGVSLRAGSFMVVQQVGAG